MTNISAETARLAGLQVDTLQKLRDGQLTLDQWERFNNLSFENREERFGDRKRSPVAKVYLRQLFAGETIAIGPTDGTETFASSGVFPGGIYGVALPASVPKSTALVNAAVYEQMVDGTFAEDFGSLGEKRTRFTEAQVVAFCRAHPGRLRMGGYATFFELEGGFVARVRFGDDGRLDVDVYPFSYVRVWIAKYQHRFVFPQQTPSS